MKRRETNRVSYRTVRHGFFLPLLFPMGWLGRVLISGRTTFARYAMTRVGGSHVPPWRAHSLP